MNKMKYNFTEIVYLMVLKDVKYIAYVVHIFEKQNSSLKSMYNYNIFSRENFPINYSS